MKITNPKDIYFLSGTIIDKKYENLLIFYLDKNGVVIEKRLIENQQPIIILSANQIFTPTLSNQAKFIILSHNHPSGNLEPSQDDLATTQKIIDAAKTLGITIIDHVVVTTKGYYSIMQKAKALLPLGHQSHP